MISPSMFLHWEERGGRIRRNKECRSSGGVRQPDCLPGGLQYLDGSRFLWRSDKIGSSVDQGGRNSFDIVPFGNLSPPIGLDIDLLILKRDIVPEFFPERFCSRATWAPLGIDDGNLCHDSSLQKLFQDWRGCIQRKRSRSRVLRIHSFGPIFIKGEVLWSARKGCVPQRFGESSFLSTWRSS